MPEEGENLQVAARDVVNSNANKAATKETEIDEGETDKNLHVVIEVEPEPGAAVVNPPPPLLPHNADDAQNSLNKISSDSNDSPTVKLQNAEVASTCQAETKKSKISEEMKKTKEGVAMEEEEPKDLGQETEEKKRKKETQAEEEEEEEEEPPKFDPKGKSQTTGKNISGWI